MDVADLISSPAFVYLAECVADKSMSEATAEVYRTKFAELYRMAHAAVEREKDAVTKAREFRALVREEQIALEKARIRKEQLEAMSTQAEAERKKLADDVSRLEARDTAMQVETNELRGLESELTEDINGLKRENEAHVLPQLAAMMQDVADTKAEVSRATSALEALVAQKTELTTRLHDMSTQVVASSTAEAALKSEVSRVQNEPERAAKALESVKRAVEDTNEEVERLKTAVELRERENADQSTALKQVATMRSDLGAKLTRYRADLAAREDECSMVETSLRSERAQYKDLLERRIDLQADDMAALSSVRASETERDSVSAAYERAKRELKRKTDSANEAEAAVPGAEAQLSEKTMALARLTSEAKTLETSLVTLKKDMDVLIANFMKEDAVEKRHRVQLAELLESCRALELEKDQWRREEALAQKQISVLKAQRDLKSRELTKLVAQRRVIIEQSKMKELQLIDLTKQLGDMNARLKQFAAMYEVVKTERNTFANNIQAASQTIAEMRERIKILHNEVDILQNESTAKDKALAKERQAHGMAAAQRDALRSEANKGALLYREKQSGVEGQIMAIDKLNSIINSLEREMLTLKKQYEAAVETRNYTGIQLIDRNDELCILYEKSNIHEKTLADGERALRVVMEEIKSLKITIQELERQLHVARSRFPETPHWAERILELQRQLVQARNVTDKLCAELESPDRSERWIPLTGEDPDVDALKVRVEDLETRVNVAREELLEKELILEEIRTLTERLQATATGMTMTALANASAMSPGPLAGAGGSSTSKSRAAAEAPGLSMAKQANELQSRIKDLNRRMMAVVSELSMYQATAIKLAAESRAAQETLSNAEAAAARGLPPTVAAEQKLQSLERMRNVPASAASARPDLAFMDGPKSTAEQRPNAYIPEGVGLPRPYGEFAPFKPVEPGVIMRHYRNPEPKPVAL